MSKEPVQLSVDDQNTLAQLSCNFPEVQARIDAIAGSSRRETFVSRMSVQEWANYDERRMDLTVGSEEI